MTKRQKATQDLTLIAVSVAIMTVCAYISVPFFSGVAFSLQLFAVFLCSAILSPRQSLLSILIYLALGLIGAPVFAGFRGGFSVLLGATGGFLIGFIPASIIIPLAKKHFGGRRAATLSAMALSLAICYLIGTLWFVAVSGADRQIGLWGALLACVVPYLLPDLIKLALAFYLSERISPLLEKINCRFC